MPTFGLPPGNSNLLNYTGAQLATIPTVSASRAPTVNDIKYPIQTIWQVGLNPTTGVYGDEYILTKIVNNLAVWSLLISPNGSGSIVNFEYVQTAVSYQVLNTDYVVAVTSTAAPRTITMPAAGDLAQRKMWVIKDESGGCSTNNITISAAANIDGAATSVLNINYGSVNVYWNGTTFFII